LFSKSRKYYFDHEAIKEPCVNGDPTSPRGSKGTSTPNAGRRGSGNKERKQRPSADTLNIGAQAGSVPWEYKELRNKRSVWNVTTKPLKEAHFAVFPPDLVEPCILAGCPIGGTVLDPFAGSGTTGMVANDNERNFIGIEINPEYVEIMKRRVTELEVVGL
jgi:DNA modification methylase